jgi:hypothetical protein
MFRGVGCSQNGHLPKRHFSAHVPLFCKPDFSHGWPVIYLSGVMDNIATYPFTLPSTAVSSSLPFAVTGSEQEGKLLQKIVGQNRIRMHGNTVNIRKIT